MCHGYKLLKGIYGKIEFLGYSDSGSKTINPSDWDKLKKSPEPLLPIGTA
jgi:hypothetical protein